MSSVGLLLVGAALLYIGGDFLVRSSVRLSARLGVSELVIGLTVVAFGTSAPELLVSLFAALQGRASISVGNIIGSNITNIALILGLSAVIAAVPVSRAVRQRELTLVLLSYCAALLLIPLGAVLGLFGIRLGGAVLLTLLVLYTWLQYRAPHPGEIYAANQDIAISQAQPEVSSVALSLAIAVASIGALSLGAHLLVEHASYIAREFLGVSERFIAVTVVALGTSAPELATAVVGAARSKTELIVGNVLGSNVFNALLVLGTAALGGGVQATSITFVWDFAIMVALTLLLIPAARRGVVTRSFGSLLLLSYCLYMVFLFQTRLI